MQISLIIPAHNEAEFIGPCLESVERYAAGKFHEVIVVDNASADGTGHVAARYEGVRVIRTETKGLTHARQVGLDSSSGEYVAYIDADCRLSESWYDIAEKHIRDFPDAVVWSGPVRYYDGSWFLRGLVVVTQRLLYPFTITLMGQWVLGGNFIARRSALVETGGFDKSIAFYGEDADIGRRLSKLGSSKFKMDLFLYTSARRIIHEGVVRTYARYTINFVWNILFHRAFTKVYTDIRT